MRWDTNFLIERKQIVTQFVSMKFNVCQIIRTNLLFVKKLELNNREIEAIPRDSDKIHTSFWTRKKERKKIVDLENKPNKRWKNTVYYIYLP